MHIAMQIDGNNLRQFVSEVNQWWIRNDVCWVTEIK